MESCFDSPLENLFFDQLRKRLPADAEFKTQVPAPTLCGVFRLDMLAIVQGRRIAFECDGKQFHDEYRDEWRDAMIMGDGQADEIFRLRGCDLTYHLDDCIFLLSKIQPLLFSERHTQVVERLASERAKRFAGDQTEFTSGVTLRYGFIGDSLADDFIDIRRRTADAQRQFWRVYHGFAQQHGGGAIDTLIDRWKASDRFAVPASYE